MSDSGLLRDELLHCDGGAADELSVIYARFHDDKQFVRDLIASLDSPRTEQAASWLLKRYLEEDGEMAGKQVGQLLKRAQQLTHWQTTLHLLQMLPMLTIPAGAAAGLHVFLKDCLQEKNKFIRAWAYGGLHILGQQHEQYYADAQACLDMAMQDEAPAVKARIRRLRSG